MIEEKISDVQAGYDRVADEYARRIAGELQHKPLDCQLLDRFGESVRDSGLTCDLGCGPGHVARYLHRRGIQVCGMDISEGMISTARRLNPDIEFSQGDMRSLPVGDNSWAGIAAFYAIVNLPPAQVAQAVREMARVLMPSGRILISFHIGEDASQVEDLWDSGAALRFHFFRVKTIETLLRDAGFELEETIERGPYAPDVEYQSQRAYIFARKPVTKITEV